jgi:hypothetical protein
MPSRACVASCRLLALATLALAAAGCHRAAPGGAGASEPAVTRAVIEARTVAAVEHPVAPAPEVASAKMVHASSDGAVPEAAAPATAPSATAPSATAEDPNAGCVATVDELPASSGLDPGDRRLRRDGVLVAHKSARRMMLFSGGRLEACWRIGLGFSPTGHKEVEGDGRTPEGWYATSDKPWSSFDDAIAIHYPNAADADDALQGGRISRRQRDLVREATAKRDVPPQRTPMGGAVLIHGGGSSSDWTLGCIALDEVDLADLRARLPRRMKTDLLVLP